MPIKLDLHIHSESRGKIYINPDQLKESLLRMDLDGVAITNFFDIQHALWLKKKLSEHIIIVGQEIWAKEGHIVGLNLERRVDDFLSAKDTIDTIHEQGGIAVAVHPFLNLGLGRKVISLPLDAVEVYNAAMGMTVIHNYLAKSLAAKNNLAQLAGSDTTSSKFVGYSYTEILTEDTTAILKTIKQGKVKLFKKPLPIPFSFILKGFLKFKNLEPCALHAVPCSVCGKSMTLRLLREKFICSSCAQVRFSRTACCNGHYVCLDCIIKNGKSRVVMQEAGRVL